MPVHQPLPTTEAAATGPHRGKGFRPDVQGLRAVAVGLVLLSHAHVPGVAGGYVGVDVFFVISGFLITGLLLGDVARGRVHFTTFYARRALRILPAATLVIVATAIASMLVLNPLRARAVLLDSVWAGFIAANLKFGSDGTDYFGTADTSPLQHFWSLAVEEQYYLVWPAVLALAVTIVPTVWARHRSTYPGLSSGSRRVGSHRPQSGGDGVPRVRVVVLLVVLGGTSLAWSVHQTPLEPTTAYFSTFARAYELVLGALLATVAPYLERVPERVRAALTWLGLAGIVVAALAFTDTTPMPGTAALLPTLATVAVLAGGVGTPRAGAHRLLGSTPFRFVGDISYSLYLWHWPLLVLGAAYVGGELRLRQSALLLVVAMVLATLSYHLVENPVRRLPLVRGTARRRRSLLLWPVALVLVVATAASGNARLPQQATVGTGQAATADPPGGAEVRKAVLAARAGEPIPANLSPTIAKIPTEQTTIGDCSGYHKESNTICQFGDASSHRTMVLFGNSHAVAWVPAFQSVAKQQGWQLFPVVKEACDFGEYLGSDRNAQCGVWYTWALGQLATIHPDLLVVNAYDQGPGWEAATEQMLTDLSKVAGRVVVLADAPGQAKKPVDCLQQDGATLATCTSAESDAIVTSRAAQKAMAARHGVAFVDVSPWFCWDRSCPSVVGNRVVLVDIGHMTRTYSLHLAPLLVPALRL